MPRVTTPESRLTGNPLRIEFTVPFFSYFLAKSAPALEPSTDFVHDDYRVTISFDGGVTTELRDVLADISHFKIVETIAFRISDSRDPSRLDALRTDRNALAQLLVAIANRVLLAIRNFGTVAHVTEASYKPGQFDSLLRKWKVQYEGDDNAMHNIVEAPQGFAALFAGDLISGSDVPEFRVDTWKAVEEAIQDQLSPGPEQEFFTNSIEYLRLRNFRLALLEAIMSLEIVTSQFLQKYLVIERRFSAARIEKVLTVQVGLTSRIGLIMELCLSSTEKERLDLDAVLVAISWRNNVIHKTGHVPQGISEEELRNRIIAVFTLVLTLAMKRDQLGSTQEMRTIAAQLVEQTQVTPTIIKTARHLYHVTFDYTPFEQFPNEDQLETTVEAVSLRLAEHDNRFNARESLVVIFNQMQRPIALWKAGALQNLIRPLEPVRPLDPPPQM